MHGMLHEAHVVVEAPRWRRLIGKIVAYINLAKIVPQVSPLNPAYISCGKGEREREKDEKECLITSVGVASKPQQYAAHYVGVQWTFAKCWQIDCNIHLIHHSASTQWTFVEYRQFSKCIDISNGLFTITRASLKHPLHLKQAQVQRQFT